MAANRRPDVPHTDMNHVSCDNLKELRRMMVHAAALVKSQRRDEAKEKRDKEKERKKRCHPKLPDFLFPLSNPDKGFHEKWHKGRCLLDIPHPFRLVLASKPNSGKTFCMKHIIMRCAQGKEPFRTIIVVHCDPENTSEYEDLDADIFSHIPSVHEIAGEDKTLVILEDLSYKDMSKDEKARLDRLFGYVSTHKNISCMLTAQDPFNVPPNVRRCTNFYIVWFSHDGDMMRNLARKCAMDKDKLIHFLANMERQDRAEGKTKPSSLWIDMTDGTPAPFRKNGFETIDERELRKYDDNGIPMNPTEDTHAEPRPRRKKRKKRE